MLPTKIQEILNLIGEKRFYMYVNGIPIGFNWTKNYLVAYYSNPTLRGAPDDHMTMKINFDEARLEDIHRTIRDGGIQKRIFVDIKYMTDPSGYRNLLTDLKNAEGQLPQKIVIALMYYLLRNSYHEGKTYQSVNVPTKIQAQKLGYKHPCLVVQTGLISRIILAVMMKITQYLNRKKMWKLRAKQIPGYKTDFF